MFGSQPGDRINKQSPYQGYFLETVGGFQNLASSLHAGKGEVGISPGDDIAALAESLRVLKRDLNSSSHKLL